MSGRTESEPLNDVNRDDELASDRVSGRVPASAASLEPSRLTDKLGGAVPRRRGRHVNTERGCTSEVVNGMISI